MKGLGKINKGIVLGSLSLTVSVLSFILNKKKLNDVERKLDVMPEIVEDLMDVRNKHNNFVEFQAKNMQRLNEDLDDIRDEIGSIYDHIECLDSKKEELYKRKEV